jgi:hypothetical protein
MKNKQEQLIEQVVREAFEEDQKAYEQVEVTLPPDFKDRILRMADAPAEPKPQLTLRKKILLLAAVLLMMCCFTGMAAYPLISAHIGHQKTEDGNGTHIDTYPTSSEVLDSIGVNYTLGKVPKGYIECWYQHDQRHTLRNWEKESLHWKTAITLVQAPAGSSWSINTTGCIEEKVVVQNFTGTWYHRKDFSCLFWITDDCVFYMCASGPEANILDIRGMADTLVPVPEDEMQ